MEDLFEHQPIRYKCLRCSYSNKIYSKFIKHLQIHYQKGTYRIPPVSIKKRLLCELRLVKIKVQYIIFPHYNINQQFKYPHGYIIWIENITNVHLELKLILFHYQFCDLHL
jgi:hypothetical protein